MVAKEAEEGSGTIRSMSPLAVSEKRRLPDGISQACRFSLCAVNRIVPAGVEGEAIQFSGQGNAADAGFAGDTPDIDKEFVWRLVVSKANSLPSSARAQQSGRRAVQRCGLAAGRVTYTAG